MTISVITLFPEMFTSVFNTSIPKRAQEEKFVTLQFVNLRDFGIGNHKMVDDKPYGGGTGMVLRVDVMDQAIQATRKNIKGEKVLLLDPRGKPYVQKTAEEFSRLEHLIVICGHYEGFDERIRDLVDGEVSIGDYVLSGGELPAMVIIDSLIRLVPGVLRKEEAHKLESFSEIQGKRVLEYPQYTRPRTYNGKSVPAQLLTGDPKKINTYQIEEAMNITKEKRPDLL